MIRLSRMADYAVVLMTCLPENRSSSKSVSDLACETRLPLPTVSRILKKLAQSCGRSNCSHELCGGWAGRLWDRDILSVAQPLAANQCSYK